MWWQNARQCHRAIRHRAVAGRGARGRPSRRRSRSVCLPAFLSVAAGLHVRLPVCMSLFVSVLMYVCLSLFLSVCLHVCLCSCLYVRMSVCLCSCLYVCMSVCLSVFLSACLHVCLCVCPYVCMSVCLHVHAYVSRHVCRPSALDSLAPDWLYNYQHFMRQRADSVPPFSYSISPAVPASPPPPLSPHLAWWFEGWG